MLTTVESVEPVKHWYQLQYPLCGVGGGPTVMISTAAFHARARGSFQCLGGFKETKC